MFSGPNIYTEIKIPFSTSPTTVKLFPPRFVLLVLTDNTPLICFDFLMLAPSVPMAIPTKSNGTLNFSLKILGYNKKKSDSINANRAFSEAV